MSSVLFVDSETYCDVPIAHGSGKYVTHCTPMIWSWAIDDLPARVWIIDDTPMPKPLAWALADPDVSIVAHNAMFDRAVMLRHSALNAAARVAGQTVVGARELMAAASNLERWHCTQAQAQAHGLPGSLDKLCDIFGIDAAHAKDKQGKVLVRLFCQPQPAGRKITRATADTHREQWNKFVEYARLDVEAMRAIWRRMPAWNYRGDELRLWHLDQRINERGVAVDVELAEAAVAAVEAEKKSLDARTAEATNGAVDTTARRDALLRYILAEHSVALPDLQADTLERRLNDPELPDAVKELIALRLQSSRASTAKYRALLRAVNDDGRLRHMFNFAGASRTRRWSGRVVQLQNLPRPDLPQHDIDLGIEALKAGVADLVVPDVMRLASNVLRGTLVAPPGRKLVVADLANIEGRLVAWLAGEQWKLDAFAAYDAGRGPDLYSLAYARAFAIDPANVNKSQRQIGKCLAAGTLVLTDSGWLPIEHVGVEHRLWDGVEWVQHKGLSANGVKSVVDVAGIDVTPDHLVLTGETWTPASELVSNEDTLSRALATGSANLPSQAFATDPPAASTKSTFNVPTFDLVSAGPRNRFTVLSARGPLIVHNCMELMLGYQGGVGAFVTGAASYGIDLDAMAEACWPSLPKDVIAEATDFLAWTVEQKRPRFGLQDRTFMAVESLKRLWRRAHPRVVQLWVRLETTAVFAVEHRGVPTACEPFMLHCGGSWLRAGLPSGNCLCYPTPRINDGRLTYQGVDQYTRQWMRIATYGGKLCIAAGTPVLTARGWIAIEQIEPGSLVWDGVEWVETGGALYNGERHVISAFGARMTPDHLVLTTEGWRVASQSTRHQRAVCRLPDGVEVPQLGRPTITLAGALRLRQRDHDAGQRIAQATPARNHGVVRVQTLQDDRHETHDTRYVGASGLLGLALDGESLHVAYASGVEELWRSWHHGLHRLARVVRGVLARYGSDVQDGPDARSQKQRRRLFARELPLDDTQRAGKQPAVLTPVYDLLDCGPRHRFAIAAGGAPLIVHNCENATQSLARDILAFAMPRAEAAGYEIVLHAHDELVAETPDDPAFNAAHLSALMATNPPWAAGLPLAAAGFECYRYRKE